MTLSKEELSGLVERVRGAKGRDIALEREIMCSVGGWHRLTASQHDRKHKHPMFVDTLEGYSSHEGQTLWRDVPRIMESVDAALALVERVHPWNPWMEIKGCQPRKDGTPGALWIVTMDGVAECRAPTLPLAILLSLLLSLQSKEPTNGL